MLVVPGSSFNVPYRNHFRVTLLPRSRTMLREVFARIERVLGALRRAHAATRVAARWPDGRMIAAPAPASYLALGDSYTIGEGVARSRPLAGAAGRARCAPKASRWPTRASSPPPAGPPTNSTGASTRPSRSGSWDFVALLIGVNNQYRGRSAVDYRGEFHALLQRAIGLRGGRAERVLVLSIPDWGVTPFARRRRARRRARSPARSMPSTPPRSEMCAGAWRGLRRHHAGRRANAAREAHAGRRRPASVGGDVRAVDAAGAAGRARRCWRQ